MRRGPHDDKGAFVTTRAPATRPATYVGDVKDLTWYYRDSEAELGIKAIDNEAMMTRPRRQRFLVTEPSAELLHAARRQAEIREALRALSSRDQALIEAAYRESRASDDPTLRATFGAAAGVVARAARAEAEAEGQLAYDLGWAKRRGLDVSPFREELRELRIASRNLGTQAVEALRGAQTRFLAMRQLQKDERRFEAEVRAAAQTKVRQAILEDSRPATGIAAVDAAMLGRAPAPPASRRRKRVAGRSAKDAAGAWFASMARAASGEAFASDDWG